MVEWIGEAVAGVGGTVFGIVKLKKRLKNRWRKIKVAKEEIEEASKALRNLEDDFDTLNTKAQNAVREIREAIDAVRDVFR